MQPPVRASPAADPRRHGVVELSIVSGMKRPASISPLRTV
jgi:hypothetical protein